MRYEDRGASADKHEVHAALKGRDGGLFPGAFCKILPDTLTGSPDHCLIIHADGAGTKSILAYLHWRETGDATVFKGIAQDSLVMNLDDLFCVGATGPFLLSNTIGRNAKLISGEVIAALVDGYRDLCGTFAGLGIEIHSGGGETADMGDSIRTLVVDSTLVTRCKRSEIITGEKIRPGLVIVGLASGGRAQYETRENSGLGSNGFTSIRHEILSPYYKEKYPEIYAPEIEPLAYMGKYRLEDVLSGSELTIGEALRSPTRTYAPVLRQVLAKHRDSVAAIFHNTGGGQTKCLRFGQGILYIKDNLFEPPPLFRLLEQESALGEKELYRSLNMGHRMEILCEPTAANAIVTIAAGFGIAAQIVGRTEPGPAGNRLVIRRGGQEFEFELGSH